MRSPSLNLSRLFLSLLMLVITLLVTAGASQGQTGILTPYDWGNVTSYQFANAFNAQPTWNGSAPTGGDTSYNEFWAPWEGASKVSYIDLGTDWADWRITATWTKYMIYRSGAGHPYAEVWWDDDTDSTNDGTTEYTLNFCTQTHDTSGSWYRDVDASSNPVVPQGRYLMLRQPSTPPSSADVIEAAFVGYIYSNEAPSVDSGSDAIVSLAAGASLDATVTDDGEPDPPGAFDVLWTKQSGPGTVTFTDDESVDTTASFSVSGIYVLRLTADDGDLTDYDEVTITVNAPPSVDAGSDDSITLPDDDVNLDATVSDDGLPNPPASVSVTWTKQSGLGTVTFGNANAVDTTAEFSAAGTYVLRLTADDNHLNAYDEVTITVVPQNTAPSVDAGSDDEITLPDDDVSLDATVSDDGLPNPPASVSVTWTKQSGPGTVTFGNANAVDTTAEFSAAGEYVLRLTASDGDLNAYDEVIITVNPAPATTGILTPTGWGNVTSYQFARAFDTQPTWNGSACTGGDTSYNEFWAPWEGASKVSYIDLGESWADWRIQQVWTKYIQYRSGSGHPYTEVWWDDDTDATNDGTTENTLNFCTQTHDSSGAWLRDVDVTSSPVTPLGRYLLLRQPSTPPASADVSEVAFVGYIASAQTNEEPSVDAGEDFIIQLPTDSAVLDGTASDDGLPDPPAALTVTWSKVSGPGTVTFDDDNILDAEATFSTDGVYVLRLTADDGDLTAYDELTITVNPAVGILTPAASGNVSGHWNVTYGFDSQPTWTGSAPTGGDTSINTIMAGWQTSGAVGYIDLGTNWAQWRILQSWTKYVSGRTNAAVPYAELWWDDDTDATNDGVTESSLNFNTSTHDSSGSWYIDCDSSSQPIVPAGRYLMVKLPTNPGGDANEYALVGYIDPNVVNHAPMAGAGEDQTIYWPANIVNLQGAASDDGEPDPPAAVTLAWTETSGPGDVTFGDSTEAETTASFSEAGTYVLRLTANDGDLSAYDEVTINVVVPSLPVLSMDEVTAFDYTQLTLVDEVDCGDPQDSHSVIESTTGVSEIQTILNRDCRVLLNPPGAEPRYFAYRIGEGCDLEAGKAYVLVVEYPEDASRSTIVLNRGCETSRTFHTGLTVGDALEPPYEHSRSTSIHFGLSQEYRTMEQLFHLHDLYPGLLQPRDNEYDRDNEPEDGFLVMIAQFANEDCPLSAGAAVARIALYEAPSLTSYKQTLATLPEGLPKRHLFWREEMSDGPVNFTPLGVSDPIDWFEYKFKLCNFLGMNTFTKDLLEFGHNQGWDCSKYGEPANAWFNNNSDNDRWEKMLYRLAEGGYDLDVLPYYEYSGGDGTGSAALGKEKRAEPLLDKPTGFEGWYTGIYWCEVTNIDCTDPDSLTDATHMFECSMTDLAAGGRPVPMTDTGGYLDTTYSTGKWGYIDLGPDWEDVRITQTWTRSVQWRGGDASPYQAVYWHSSPTGFSGSTVPQGAVQENTLNFITKTLRRGWSVWTQDVSLSEQNAITPSGRYLVLRAANEITDAHEFLIVGWIEDGGDPEIQTIPVYGAGSVDGHNLSPMFDKQPPFNTHTTNFVGAWLRPRPSQIPIGFGDATRARFATEANGGQSVTKAQLLANQSLLDDYYDWWMGRRQDFLEDLRDYLQTNVNSDAVVLYTWDIRESGAGLPNHPKVVTDDTDIWDPIVSTMMDYDDAVDDHLHLDAMLTPRGFYDWQEMQHASPWPDPDNYSSTEGVMLTHTFNKLYTVSDPDTWDTFQTGSGLTAIRHYCLNEDATKWNGSSCVGYFVTDAERAGPYCMIGEARAMALGDPFYVGYLSSNSFNRCFPGYVRDFNANYLALPAISSTIVTNAASDSEVVVRRINTTSDGTWLAIINTSIEEKSDVVITLPVSGTVTDAVTGASVTVTNGTITLDLWPGQLDSFHVE